MNFNNIDPSSITPAFLQAALSAATARVDRGEGRSLEQLLQSNDLLNSQESQRLRSWFCRNGVQPSRDLDSLGMAVMLGNLDKVVEDFSHRIIHAMASEGKSEADARESAAQQLYALRWGPTRIPIYNVILVGTVLAAPYRAQQLALARWLADEARVPADGTDVSGAQALHHALSCAPVVDIELAEIMERAGADVNHRDRHGCTPMHEALQVSDGTSAVAVRPRRDALVWYLAHGGNMDIADNEGTRARDLLKKANRLWMTMGHFHVLELVERVEDEDRRRKTERERCCAFCGRGPEESKQLLLCSKCKVARYCPPPRGCQLGDWPQHKLSCGKASSP